jgi:hypothetical protein
MMPDPRQSSRQAATSVGSGVRCLGWPLSLLACGLSSGCLERTVSITSEPPGAVVWMNDTEVGRTPLKTGFIYFGEYDVRVRKEGYEPISTHRTAKAPVSEAAPVDIFATAWPGRVKTEIAWHFDLTPVEPAGEKELIDRARELQAKVPAAPASADPQNPSP